MSDVMNDIQGCGIGLRGAFINEVQEAGFKPDWFEITPENWMHMPRGYQKSFLEIAAEFPLVAHGVSLSLGSPEPPDHVFLTRLKDFLDRYNIQVYSEHLSFSAFNGSQSYELLPVPMTLSMADFIAEKIKMVNDVLERNLVLENASWYYMPYAEMDEVDFINTVLEKSGSAMLLDVNNIYVNSQNHQFDPYDFINRLEIEKTAYIHIAGHTFFPEDNLIIDTHGESVRQEVFDLLHYTLSRFSRRVPVMIERDNDIPALSELIKEYRVLEEIVEKNNSRRKSHA